MMHHRRPQAAIATAIGAILIVVAASAPAAASDTASLLISVIDPDGNPVPYPEVRFMPAADDATHDWRRLASDTRVFGTQLLAENIQPGDYWVYISGLNHGYTRVRMTFGPGENKLHEPVTLYPDPGGGSSKPAPNRPPAPQQSKPSRSAADDCLARVDAKYAELWAIHAAQDPSDGNVWLPWDDTPECNAAAVECSERVADEYAACPPGPDGTYQQCQITAATQRVECSRRSLECGERAARAACRGGASGAVPATRSPHEDSPTCTAEIRAEIAEKRAHNAAQTIEGGVSTVTMNRVDACAEAFNACWAKAREVYAACPPGSDGTYLHCQQTQSRTFVRCAQEEIDCTARALGCS